jgi:hypothetical protein
MRKLLIAVLSAFVVTGTGCASIQQGMEADQTIRQAEKEIAAAKGVNFVWRDTEKALAGAKKAYAEEDYETATKLAKKALKEAQLAQSQAQREANARPVYF